MHWLLRLNAAAVVVTLALMGLSRNFELWSVCAGFAAATLGAWLHTVELHHRAVRSVARRSTEPLYAGVLWPAPTLSVLCSVGALAALVNHLGVATS